MSNFNIVVLTKVIKSLQLMARNHRPTRTLTLTNLTDLKVLSLKIVINLFRLTRDPMTLYKNGFEHTQSVVLILIPFCEFYSIVVHS